MRLLYDLDNPRLYSVIVSNCSILAVYVTHFAFCFLRVNCSKHIPPFSYLDWVFKFRSSNMYYGCCGRTTMLSLVRVGGKEEFDMTPILCCSPCSKRDFCSRFNTNVSNSCSLGTHRTPIRSSSISKHRSTSR